MQTATARSFQYVQEKDDAFFSLFPHRYDYIWAEHPEPNQRPAWKTESRYPLSDRLIQQGSNLYGVRFGAETSYCLLDIDRGSLYHPQQDPLAMARLVAALEPLGLINYVACTSSHSGGLHLYFPFQQAQSSWKLAISVSTLLENAGFKLKPGHLEVFPDPKPYSVNGQPSLFNAHRLPLQMGSYLMNYEFQPIWSTQQTFVQQWRFAQTRNDVERSVILRLLKQVKRHRYAVSTKAEKFINDLNAEIEFGWTGAGQTNYLLGRITMREYIFRHVLGGSQPLAGPSLVTAIMEVARSLPGYAEYCRHQHEIEQRAQEWARCIENSHYFHYGDAAGKFKAKADTNQPDATSSISKAETISNGELQKAIERAPSWNQQQTDSARDRIRHAIADLLEQEVLPIQATGRFHALVSYGIGGGTLYHHRDLWHPRHLAIDDVSMTGASNAVTAATPVENPPYPPAFKMDRASDCFEAVHAHSSVSLLPIAGSNHASGNDPGDLAISARETGRNFVPASTVSASAQAAPDPSDATSYAQQVLFELKAVQDARQAAAQEAYEQQQSIRRQASEAKVIARMQQFLDSGDSILMAEALAWAAVNPGLLHHTAESEAAWCR